MPDRRRSPLVELTRARVLELFREPEAVFWVFVFPLVLAFLLGLAFRESGPEKALVAVYGPGASALLEKLGAGKTGGPVPLPIEWVSAGGEEALSGLRGGRFAVAVEAGGEGPGALKYLIDPSRPGAPAARLAADAAIQEAFGRKDPVPSETVEYTGPGGRYIDFLLPGLIGLNIMGNCLWGIGYVIVDSRRRKLLKRFVVTPMLRSHFLLSFALSRLAFLVLEIAVLGIFGALVFGVTLRGSPLVFAAVSLAGVLSFSGIALLIGARTASTEAASGWMSAVQLPMWLLSGTFFSYAKFPEWSHPLIRLLPLTAFNDAARAVVNEGAGFEAAGMPILVMCAWGLVSFAAALVLFRWR